jgi:hypothetical protein
VGNCVTADWRRNGHVDGVEDLAAEPGGELRVVGAGGGARGRGLGERQVTKMGNWTLSINNRKQQQDRRK